MNGLEVLDRIYGTQSTAKMLTREIPTLVPCTTLSPEFENAYASFLAFRIEKGQISTYMISVPRPQS